VTCLPVVCLLRPPAAEYDQQLAVQSHFEAIAQAGAERGLEGESPLGGVVMRARVFEPEFDLERSHGNGVRTVTDVGPVGFDLERAVVSRPAQGSHEDDRAHEGTHRGPDGW
jgi:hypothetical protein